MNSGRFDNPVYHYNMKDISHQQQSWQNVYLSILNWYSKHVFCYKSCKYQHPNSYPANSDKPSGKCNMSWFQSEYHCVSFFLVPDVENGQRARQISASCDYSSNSLINSINLSGSMGLFSKYTFGSSSCSSTADLRFTPSWSTMPVNWMIGRLW